MDRRRLVATAPVAVLVALVFGPTVVFAHAVVVHTSLEDAPPKAGQALTVTLRFNAAVEPRFSQVFLRSADGREQALTLAPGPSPDRLTVEIPPLPAGAYGLRYKVLAADGHFTENGLRFKVTE